MEEDLEKIKEAFKIVRRYVGEQPNSFKAVQCLLYLDDLFSNFDSGLSNEENFTDEVNDK
jgi:hypothetical protein